MKVGLVVPCFDEASRWSANYWTHIAAESDANILFVDDGSTDATNQILQGFVTGTKHRVRTLERNAGKSEAVRLGMQQLIQESECAAVGYLDADGAFTAEDVLDVIASFQARVIDSTFDAVWSSRVALAGRDIARSNSRHYIGRLVATFVSAGYGSIPYDTQSGLKLFAPSPALKACLEEPFRTRWLFELELLARWQRFAGESMRIWEEPLNYWHDVPGSKIKGKEVTRVLRELIVVKREQRHLGAQRRQG